MRPLYLINKYFFADSDGKDYFYQSEPEILSFYYKYIYEYQLNEIEIASNKIYSFMSEIRIGIKHHSNNPIHSSTTGNYYKLSNGRTLNVWSNSEVY